MKLTPEEIERAKSLAPTEDSLDTKILGKQPLTANEDTAVAPDYLEAPLIGLGQGLTGEFGTRLLSGAQAGLPVLFGDKDADTFEKEYEKKLKHNQEVVELAHKEHPWLTGAGEVAGFALGPGKLLKPIVGALGMGGLYATEGAGLLGKTAKLAGTGAVETGLIGAEHALGTSKDLTDVKDVASRMGHEGLASFLTGALVNPALHGLLGRVGLGAYAEKAASEAAEKATAEKAAAKVVGDTEEKMAGKATPKAAAKETPVFTEEELQQKLDRGDFGQGEAARQKYIQEVEKIKTTPEREAVVASETPVTEGLKGAAESSVGFDKIKAAEKAAKAGFDVNTEEGAKKLQSYTDFKSKNLVDQFENARQAISNQFDKVLDGHTQPLPVTNLPLETQGTIDNFKFLIQNSIPQEARALRDKTLRELTDQYNVAREHFHLMSEDKANLIKDQFRTQFNKAINSADEAGRKEFQKLFGVKSPDTVRNLEKGMRAIQSDNLTARGAQDLKLFINDVLKDEKISQDLRRTLTDFVSKLDPIMHKEIPGYSQVNNLHKNFFRTIEGLNLGLPSETTAGVEIAKPNASQLETTYPNLYRNLRTIMRQRVSAINAKPEYDKLDNFIKNLKQISPEDLKKIGLDPKIIENQIRNVGEFNEAAGYIKEGTFKPSAALGARGVNWAKMNKAAVPPGEGGGVGTQPSKAVPYKSTGKLGSSVNAAKAAALHQILQTNREAREESK